MPAYSWQRPTQQYERDVVTEWPHGPRPSAAVKNAESSPKKRSVERRPMRAVVRFFIAILIGVGATLAWQSYGDEAKEMARTSAPSLAWVLASSTRSPRDAQVSAVALLTDVGGGTEAKACGGQSSKCAATHKQASNQTRAARGKTRKDGSRRCDTAGNRAGR